MKIYHCEHTWVTGLVHTWCLWCGEVMDKGVIKVGKKQKGGKKGK